MKAKFLKKRVYKGKLREVGEIVDMDLKCFQAYKSYKVVKLFIPERKTTENSFEVEMEKIKTVEFQSGQEILDNQKKQDEQNNQENPDKQENPDLNSMTLKELQKLCKENELQHTGKKQDLIDSLKAFYKQ